MQRSRFSWRREDKGNRTGGRWGERERRGEGRERERGEGGRGSSEMQ